MPRTSLGLVDLPVEVWAYLIERHITVHDLMSFKMIGNTALWQKITMPGVIRKLTIPAGHNSSILTIPYLKHLEMTITNSSPTTHKMMASITESLEALTLNWSPVHYSRRTAVLPVSIL